MSGCHVPAVGGCSCQCHTTGIKTMYAVNPPKPCCLCEAMTYGVVSPIKQESDVEILLERIEKLESDYQDKATNILGLICNVEAIFNRLEKLENFVGQNYKVDYAVLLDMIGNLSMRLNKLESSLREFEKQRVIPISKRVDALEEQQTKQEVRLCDLQDSWVNLMAERDTFANYMVDHEKRLYKLEEGECSGTLRTR